MTREDRLAEIDDYVRYLDLLYTHAAALLDVADIRVVALGFSQGVATVCRWAARTSHRVDHLVLWASTVPPELEIRPDVFGDARLTLVTGETDPYATAAALDREIDRLAAGGVRPDVMRFPGGHHLDAETLECVARG
jgi:predicted esterase